jgi:alcohol dehydrogenase
MRQLTFVEAGKLVWEDVPEPKLTSPSAALVRPRVVTNCDLDLPVLRGFTPYQGPFAFGHEFVAEVVAVGESVFELKPGTLVSVPFQLSCGRCDRCRRGLTGSCREYPSHPMYGLAPLGGECGGAFADLVLVPHAEAMLVPLPSGVDPVVAASVSDNLPDAYRAVGPALLAAPGAPVLIAGGLCQNIGLYAVAIAKAMGASEVHYLDQDPERLQCAERLGAIVRDGPFPKKAGEFAVTVDASGDPDGLRCALRSLEPEGLCTSVAIYFQKQELSLVPLYTSGIRFHTSRCNARTEMPKVLDLIQGGRLKPEAVTTHTLRFEDAPEALGAGFRKVVFRQA